MNEENMKKFIESNKQSFDSEKPSNAVWQNLESELAANPKTSGKMISIRSFWMGISGVAAVFLVAFFALQSTPDSSGGLAQEVINLDEISDVEQLEKYYSVQVDSKIEELKQYEVDDDLMAEIQLLKEEFDELKNESGTGFNQKKILDSMIDNYRLRVSILEDIMKEMSRKSDKVEEDVVQ